MSSGSNTTPDFIGIGAQRSGTTWVANVMSLHPEIWVPPLKELHYFDSVSVEHYTAGGAATSQQARRARPSRKRG
ncbi:MAG: sulfotransferase [Pseudomonadota bacterium]|nr:sulfotransferase [Pseudomonadota bacterium]